MSSSVTAPASIVGIGGSSCEGADRCVLGDGCVLSAYWDGAPPVAPSRLGPSCMLSAIISVAYRFAPVVLSSQDRVCILPSIIMRDPF